MLAALDEGVKGGKWFSLIDKVYSMDNLRDAYAKVKANNGSSGVDHQSVSQYGEHLHANLCDLHIELKEGKYRPQPIRRVWIPKPGSSEKRPLGIPTVRDRVVQTALRNVLEPIFERGFSGRSYGFRPGLGCKDALRRVYKLQLHGYTCVVDADLKSYFDTIPHKQLLGLIRQKVSDGKVLQILRSFLQQGVLDTLGEYEPEEGTPQGAVISPLLANIYLDPLDHLMEKLGIEMVRYADDLVIMCKDQSSAQVALSILKDWTSQAGLTLHPEKTRIVDTHNGTFGFLGYLFDHGKYLHVRAKSIKKLKDTVRAKTHRTNGKSLQAIIDELNRSLQGWCQYFKHSQGWLFGNLDKWVRMRLRSILRKRDKRRGAGRGWDHVRWPIEFFEQYGLFSLQAARRKYCQSSPR